MLGKIVFVGMLICYVQGDADKARMLHKTCVDETGVSEDVLREAQIGLFANDTTLKCYMKCVLNQLGALHDDGKFDLKVIVDIMPKGMKEESERVMKACENEEGANLCEQAFNINVCCFKMNPKAYFLI